MRCEKEEVVPSARVRVMVVLGAVVAPALVVLMLAAPVPTVTEEARDLQFLCGRLAVPRHQEQSLHIERIVSSGVRCAQARDVVADMVLGRDVGARRGYVCSTLPPFEASGYSHPGSGTCEGRDGGHIHWTLG